LAECFAASDVLYFVSHVTPNFDWLNAAETAGDEPRLVFQGASSGPRKVANELRPSKFDETGCNRFGLHPRWPSIGTGRRLIGE
jgi:hypothetical protein